MIDGYKVVVVTPAGRRRFMPLIRHYMEAELDKGTVDEWRLWCNTTELADIKCLSQIAREGYPRITIQYNDNTEYGILGSLGAIRAFYTDETMDSNTIYFRIDDDICWVHPEAIANMLRFRLDNPDYLMIASNMVNSGLCSHLHMRCGAHPAHHKMDYIPWTCIGGTLWKSPEMATLIHHQLLHDIQNDTLDKWMSFDRYELHEHIRFGVAFCCFFGKDARKFMKVWKGLDDEQFLSEMYPIKVGKLNCIYGKGLVSHFGYNPQREAGLESSSVPVTTGNELTRPCGILNRYRDLVGVKRMKEIPIGKLNG